MIYNITESYNDIDNIIYQNRLNEFFDNIEIDVSNICNEYMAELSMRDYTSLLEENNSEESPNKTPSKLKAFMERLIVRIRQLFDKVTSAVKRLAAGLYQNMVASLKNIEYKMPGSNDIFEIHKEIKKKYPDIQLHILGNNDINMSKEEFMYFVNHHIGESSKEIYDYMKSNEREDFLKDKLSFEDLKKKSFDDILQELGNKKSYIRYLTFLEKIKNISINEITKKYKEEIKSGNYKGDYDYIKTCNTIFNTYNAICRTVFEDISTKIKIEKEMLSILKKK